VQNKSRSILQIAGIHELPPVVLDIAQYKEDITVQIERGSNNNLVENQLPDGSRILVDSKSETVYALNATAGAAWDACGVPTNLDNVTNEMRYVLGNAITEELAQEAVLRLQEQKLVTTSMMAQQKSRREVLTTLGKVALPLVVAMTLTEQRAHASVARSGTPCTPPPPPPPRRPMPDPIIGGKGNPNGFFG
jgi:hypothetical protein